MGQTFVSQVFFFKTTFMPKNVKTDLYSCVLVGLYPLRFLFYAVQALELLAVLMVDGPEGYRAVLAAMDYFKLVKGERVRFYSLLDALMTDEADLAFKRDVMLFINTLVNR